MTEVFPNAENAFRDAFNHPDPVPQLLELIIARPDVSAILDLIVVYMELIGESPTQCDKFATTLVKLQASKGITIAGGDGLGNPVQIEIADALYDQLLRIHSGSLVVAREPSVSPTNQYLIDSLLSAISIKYGLCNTHSAAFPHGLHHKPKHYRQVYVLGACLQLLVSGSYMYGPTRVSTDDVLTTLEKIKKSGIVKGTNGRRLLEVAIEQTKGGFKSDVAHAWEILFPQQVARAQ